MAHSPQFKKKLQHCDLEVRQYIATLESQNRKLQRQVGRLEATNMSEHNRIKALEEAINGRDGRVNMARQ